MVQTLRQSYHPSPVSRRPLHVVVWGFGSIGTLIAETLRRGSVKRQSLLEEGRGGGRGGTCLPFVGTVTLVTRSAAKVT